MKSMLRLFAASVCALFTQVATAAPLHLEVDVDSFGFEGLGWSAGIASPISQLDFTFRLQFDTAADITSTSNGLNVLSTNFATNSPIYYTYHAGWDFLTLGNSHVGLTGCVFLANSMCLFISQLTSDHPTAIFTVITNDSMRAWGTTTSRVTTSRIGVPEPSSVALVVLALVALGFAVTRRQPRAVSPPRA